MGYIPVKIKPIYQMGITEEVYIPEINQTAKYKNGILIDVIDGEPKKSIIPIKDTNKYGVECPNGHFFITEISDNDKKKRKIKVICKTCNKKFKVKLNKCKEYK